MQHHRIQIFSSKVVSMTREVGGVSLCAGADSVISLVLRPSAPQEMGCQSGRIAGKLTLVSSSSSGTEIKLVVPGGIVFGKTMPVQQSLFMKIRSLFGSKRTRNLD